MDLSEEMDLLARTPRALRALLEGLDPAWAERDYGAGTFTCADIVGHLSACERDDWIPRVRHILEHGDARPFPPVDRYAHLEARGGRGLDALLAEFDGLRAQSLATLASLRLGEADLRRRGLHPALGPVTLAQLLATWVAHDHNHLAQLARVLAERHREAVGPWSAYLGVYRAPATPMDAAGLARRAAVKEAQIRGGRG